MSPLLGDSTYDPSQDTEPVDGFRNSGAVDELVRLSYEGASQPDDDELGRRSEIAESLIRAITIAELRRPALRIIAGRVNGTSNTAEMFKALLELFAPNDKSGLITELRDFMPPGWEMEFPSPNAYGGLRVVRVNVPPSGFEVFCAVWWSGLCPFRGEAWCCVVVVEFKLPLT
ncbi:hypothetical protein M409DRAFT_52158 [Zasmidium cellare ATCC 36951]|uniref:Uncharacterized protein n=1 Tax=Zasmidium cellare ATCC 36951 TaxID=1080233 RepID=A0A6A6CTY0_ZASCE|nr:uncharacterized protein M409DRAFT_52158 [Zasmidium cellare ATCC 36951]KAF2169638.1 hypothetical protein M409DRAFT_52158 [Zasmidium cellare ATCC 36951]